MKSNLFLKVKPFVLALAFIYFLLGFNHTVNAEKVALADKGLALHSVVLGVNASEQTRNAAEDLATYLSRITGGRFSVTVGDGTEGIAVGTYRDFPLLGLDYLFDSEDLTRRDEYLLRTHNKGVYLVGATDLATQHAVWGFLYEMGHRQFFPTDSWEIIPEESNLSADLDAFEKPDFYNRLGPRVAPYSYKESWQRWHDRNRMTSAFMVDTQHVYDEIITRNQAEFNEHPEYIALVDGMRIKIRDNTKFCISNDGLRQLVVEDAKRRIMENPEVTSISMDPSDSGGWCECEKCAEMGSITDRVVILANDVAEAINNMGYGEKYVGIYAYYLHSLPPSIDVHPNVIVSIATKFLRGYTVEELIEGWSKHTKTIGIREYHDVFPWSWGLPLQAVGGDINYLVEKIPYFYNKGARFMNSESSDSWGPNGLGYYLSSLILWDLDAINRVDEIVNDFLEKSFKEAKEPMRKFYYMINQDYATPRSNDDLLANMYGYINDARKLTKDSKVLTRLDELVLYTRYVELMYKFRGTKGDDARVIAAQDLYRHAFRMQKTMHVHTYVLFRRLQRMGKGILGVPDNAHPGGAVSSSFPFSRLSRDEDNPGHLSIDHELEDMEPWKSSRDFTEDEIKQFIADGITNYKKDKIEFEITAFSENLEPAAQALGLKKVSTGDMGSENSFRGNDRKIFTWFRPDSKQLNMQVTGGFIERLRFVDNVKFELFSPQEVMLDPVDTNESVPPNGESYEIVLKSPYDGLHQLEWRDGGAMTRFKWPEGHPMTVQANMENPINLERNFELYFYVPKGTRIVGGHTSSKNFQMFDSNSNSVLDLRKETEGYFNVHVPQGQDGALWKIQGSLSTVMLLTVPPYLARNEKELLLPKEVIEADKMN